MKRSLLRSSLVAIAGDTITVRSDHGLLSGTVHDWDDTIRVVRIIIPDQPGVHCFSYDQIVT